MTIHNRKLKTLTLRFGTAPDEEEFQCQVKNWVLDPGDQEGEVLYSYCGPGTEGEAREEANPNATLQVDFYSDWRDNGVSKYLWRHRGEELAFRVDHHEDIPAEATSWSGTLKCIAPPVGGEARTTEMSSVTFPIIGEPEFHPNGAESA